MQRSQVSQLFKLHIYITSFVGQFLNGAPPVQEQHENKDFREQFKTANEGQEAEVTWY